MNKSISLQLYYSEKTKLNEYLLSTSTVITPTEYQRIKFSRGTKRVTGSNPLNRQNSYQRSLNSDMLLLP